MRSTFLAAITSCGDAGLRNRWYAGVCGGADASRTGDSNATALTPARSRAGLRIGPLQEMTPARARRRGEGNTKGSAGTFFGIGISKPRQRARRATLHLRRDRIAIRVLQLNPRAATRIEHERQSARAPASMPAQFGFPDDGDVGVGVVFRQIRH